MKSHTCNRRLFLIGTATTFTGALLTACGSQKQTIDATDAPVGSAIIGGDFPILQPTPGLHYAYPATCPHPGPNTNQGKGHTGPCTNHTSVLATPDCAPACVP
ncbi:Rieske (2Fe-2S) protein, partial [Corynebacterium durum]|uniref:Rieske (2Fe-2S) protein n=1 Tax=Corynebacterium durum TaxID=61592 RepID=UPI002880388D